MRGAGRRHRSTFLMAWYEFDPFLLRNEHSQMKQWDATALSKSLQFGARMAEQYADKLSAQLKRPKKQDVSHERELHDEHRAKWFVYDSFVGASCLESREKLLAEAKARLARGISFTPSNVFNRENFEAFWRKYMAQLIKDVE